MQERTEKPNDMMGQQFQEWAIVELMGHRKIAGKVTEEQIGGTAFLRVDMFNQDDDDPILTQFYQPSALYCLTPTSERIARALGESFLPVPVSRFDFPQLPAGYNGEEDENF